MQYLGTRLVQKSDEDLLTSFLSNPANLCLILYSITYTIFSALIGRICSNSLLVVALDVTPSPPSNVNPSGTTRFSPPGMMRRGFGSRLTLPSSAPELRKAKNFVAKSLAAGVAGIVWPGKVNQQTWITRTRRTGRTIVTNLNSKSFPYSTINRLHPQARGVETPATRASKHGESTLRAKSAVDFFDCCTLRDTVNGVVHTSTSSCFPYFVRPV